MTDILNEQDKLPFSEALERAVRLVIDQTMKSEGVSPRGVSVLITDDEGVQSLNGQYRGKDAPTDVLSFPLSDEDGNLDEECLGDIAISLERAQAQAEQYGHSLQREVAFLTAHSMLHLLGYDHEQSEQQETTMFEKQKAILAELGFLREGETPATLTQQEDI